MPKPKRKYYTVRWAMPGHPSLGNVSFFAGDDGVAKRRADRVAKQINLRNTPRTITEGNRMVEVLERGMTKPD